MSEEAAHPLSYETPSPLPPPRYIRILFVTIECMVLAWLVGALTNFINGNVSLPYFQVMVGWLWGKMGVHHAVLQGLLEATPFGLALAFIFTIVYVAVTGARCRMRYIHQLLGIGATVAVGCAMIGGMIGSMWASLYPASFRTCFQRVPSDMDPITGWGWVGGAIWGVEFGAVICIIGLPITLVALRRRWTNQPRVSG